MADLEQVHARVLVRRVVGDGLQQSGEQRRAQHRLLGRQRVGDLDRVGREPRTSQVVGREEARGPRLPHAGTREHVAHPPAVALVVREATHARHRRHRPVDARVAVMAGHLLDDIDLALAVGPPRRNRDVEGQNGQPRCADIHCLRS